jgi:hypothetical protein
MNIEATAHSLERLLFEPGASSFDGLHRCTCSFDGLFTAVRTHAKRKHAEEEGILQRALGDSGKTCFCSFCFLLLAAASLADLANHPRSFAAAARRYRERKEQK